MNQNKYILLHIEYPGGNDTLQFLKYQTVRDLKNEIFQKSGITPEKQIIECWNKPPKSDTSTLLTCCLPNDCNYLIVKNKDEIHQEVSQTSAISTFVEYFSSNYTTTGIIFPNCSLDEAIKKSFSTIEANKILILYLHNKNDEFANIFCEQLTIPSIQNLLNRKFFLLCWDVQEDNFKNILINALQKYEELESFTEFVETKICAALLIARLDNAVTVVNVMRENLSPEEFLETLNNSQEFLNEVNIEQPNVATPSQTEQRHIFGSQQYQQLMLDLLGDRDYDSFDFYEFEYLKEKIGYSLYGPPQNEDGYDEKQKTRIDLLFHVIQRENDLISKWKDRIVISFIYICIEPLPAEKLEKAKNYPDYDPESDLTPIPVFVLRKCKHSQIPCRIFIDDIGRVYTSFNNYLTNNKLPKCEMVYPINGRYDTDRNGNVMLGRKESPACSLGNSILNIADVASAVGGVASGGVMIAAASLPAVAAAPLLVPAAGIGGAVAGVYSLARSGLSLYDRNKHKESISFFECPEARGAYINLVAGSLGFVGSGANVLVSKLTAEGFNIGQGAVNAVNTLNIVNLGASGVGVVNASYDVIRNWWYENETPSLLTIVQLSSSILFFGHAVYNYRSLNSVIEETQANTLREYQESLRSNRHRKAFTKLVKETIRQNDGNHQQGRAEVISTIKNIQNKDEVFASLTRANKNMNRHNVRFAAQNGEITLNGVAVDMKQFSNMQKNEVITFLNQLPNMPKPSTPNIRNMSLQIRNNFPGINTSQLAALSYTLIQLFANTDLTIKDKILNAVAKLIQTLLGDSRNFMDELDRIFPHHDKYFRLVTMVNSCFQRLINVIEDKYKLWLQTRNPADAEPYFIQLINFDTAKRAVYIFNEVTENYFNGTVLTEYGLKQLLDYFYVWFTHEVYTFEERQTRRRLRNEHTNQSRQRNLCPECGGHFYSSSNQ